MGIAGVTDVVVGQQNSETKEKKGRLTGGGIDILVMDALELYKLRRKKYEAYSWEQGVLSPLIRS